MTCCFFTHLFLLVFFSPFTSCWICPLNPSEAVKAELPVPYVRLCGVCVFSDCQSQVPESGPPGPCCEPGASAWLLPTLYPRGPGHGGAALSLRDMLRPGTLPVTLCLPLLFPRCFDVHVLSS